MPLLKRFSTLSLLLSLWLGAFTAAHAEVTEKIAAAGRALAAGDLGRAEKLFTEARDQAPKEPLPWLGLSEVGERRGELLEALEQARKAEQLATDKTAALLVIGRLQVRLKAIDEALKTYARVRELAPKQPQAYLTPAIVLRDVDQAPKAIDLLQQALAKGLEEPQINEQLGFLLLANGEPQQAQEVARTALKKHPQRGDLKLLLGLALAAEPQTRAEAPQWIEEALTLGVADEGRVRLELAGLLIEQDRKEEALQHLRQAQEALPDSPEVYYRLGNALRAAGDTEGARQALLRFRQLSGQEDNLDHQHKEVGATLNEIQNLAANNRLPEALEAVQGLLLRTPQEPRALALQGKILFSMGRREEALASMQEATHLAPNRVEHHYLAGVFLLQLNRAQEAEQALIRSLALDPQLAQAHALLGIIASRRQNSPQTVASLSKAFELGAEGVDLRLAYAEALKDLGRAEESAEQMEIYQQLRER